ncbi:hypothetical protein AB5N19_02581 [Seiridium cardinale]
MSDTTQIAESSSAMEPKSTPPQPLTPVEECKEPTGTQDSTAKDTVLFNKDYDTVLKFTSEWAHLQYKVNSFNLSSASDAFGRLLFGVDGQSKDEQGTRVIELPDNATAFEVIMQIVHFQFGKVPKSPSIDELFNICILTSKYECTHLIQPWAEKWSALLTGFANNEAVSLKNYKALWVAWVLGCVGPFREMTDSIILTSEMNANGELIHASGSRLEDVILPHGLLDGIFKIRAQVLAAILDEIRKPMDHVYGSNPCSTAAYCKVKSDFPACEMMMVASASRTLRPAGLDPVPEATKYSRSVAGLKDTVYDIEYLPWVGKDHAPHKSHVACNLGLKDAIKSILNNMASPVRRMHLEHLARQAAITVVDNGNALLGFESNLSATAPEFNPATSPTSLKSSTDSKTEAMNDEGVADGKEKVDVQSSEELASSQEINSTGDKTSDAGEDIKTEITEPKD